MANVKLSLKQGVRTDNQGFTLIEVIAVIIVLSIVAALGSSFIITTMDSYQKTQSRANLINKSRAAVERMTRQLRGSAPYSLRVVSSAAGGSCIEFLPIAASGSYLGVLPDSSNGAAASATLTTMPYNLDFASGRYVMVGALSSDEIYGAGAVSRASATAPIVAAGIGVTLSGAKQWQRNSPTQRFYIADNPQAFCLDGTELNHYDSQNIDNGGVTGAAASVLAFNVSSASTPFSLSSGSEDRNVLLNINLAFSEGSESVTFLQEVSIRNVP